MAFVLSDSWLDLCIVLLKATPEKIPDYYRSLAAKMKKKKRPVSAAWRSVHRYSKIVLDIDFNDILNHQQINNFLVFLLIFSSTI